MKKTIEEKARDMVGDGKRPDKFWLSVSSDYSYWHVDEDGAACVDYIGDLIPGWEEQNSKGKMIAMYKTLDEAIEHAEEDFYIGMEYEGFTVNRITIEDRLVGVIWERTLIFDPITGKKSKMTNDDRRMLR